MWLYFVAIFIVCQIVFLQLFKVATRNSKSLGALTIVVQVISAVSILVLAPLFEWVWPTHWLTWLLLGIALVLYAVDDRLDAHFRKNLDISVDAMIQQIYRIFFFISGIIFLGRSFTWLKLIGALLIVFANVFLLFEKGKFKFNRHIVLKALSTLIFTAAFTIETYNSPEFNLPFFVFLSYMGPALFLFIGQQAKPRQLIDEVKRKEWPIIVLCGVAQALTTFSILRAYQFQDKFMEVGGISAVYVILNAFFAYFFLKERSGLVKKLIIAGVIVLSILLMIFGDKVLALWS